MISKIINTIFLLLLSHSILGQINSSELSLSEKYKTTLMNINKSFIIDGVKDEYLKKESIFIKESDIIEKKWDKRNLALNSIKLLATNKDTIYYCERGLNFNENQMVLYKIKNTINNTNFENADNKKIELLENLIKQLEELPKLEEDTKLENRKKQFYNLFINYKKIIKIKSYNSLKIRFNKAENDAIVDELTKLPVLDESENIEIEKRNLKEILKNYEDKIEKLKNSLEQYTLFEDNPSSEVRDEKYDNLKKEYKDYPYLVSVIEKSKKNENAFKNELYPSKKNENNTMPSETNNNGAKTPVKSVKVNPDSIEEKKVVK